MSQNAEVVTNLAQNIARSLYANVGLTLFETGKLIFV
jgi:hypothetical protein